jgi:hypothetical protein
MQQTLEYVFMDILILWGVITFAAGVHFVWKAHKEITGRKK